MLILVGCERHKKGVVVEAMVFLQHSVQLQTHKDIRRSELLDAVVVNVLSEPQNLQQCCHLRKGVADVTIVPRSLYITKQPF